MYILVQHLGVTRAGVRVTIGIPRVMAARRTVGVRFKGCRSQGRRGGFSRAKLGGRPRASLAGGRRAAVGQVHPRCNHFREKRGCALCAREIPINDGSAGIRVLCNESKGNGGGGACARERAESNGGTEQFFYEAAKRLRGRRAV